MKKKLLGMLLALCTTFMLLPTITFAQTPDIVIEGKDTYCRGVYYSFSFEIPEGIKSFYAGYEFKYVGTGHISLEQNGNVYTAKVDTSKATNDEQSFTVYVFAQTEDNVGFRVDKKVTLKNHSGGIATCSQKAICETCYNEYGDYDEDVHSIEHVDAKDPTLFEDGNIEYYTCTGCNKAFSDSEGNNEIFDVMIDKLPPEIIKGNGQIVKVGSKKALSFTSSASINEFKYVIVDDEELGQQDDFTLQEGSIIVTLNPDYVSTLALGKHTITIGSERGEATAEFEVSESEPVNEDEVEEETKKEETKKEDKKTGTNTSVIGNAGLWMSLMFTSLDAMGIGWILNKKKRK
ncbi:hypothetical protein [Floccifex sp.]|uniref:hypothetical protein n=1 Tax=Floccifex sp. TaxID=2815810 RepID=UPI003F0F9D5D